MTTDASGAPVPVEGLPQPETTPGVPETTDAAPTPKGGTYVLKDPETEEVVRSGRTNDHTRRRSEHGRNPKLKNYDYDVDSRTDDYAEQRGREQILDDKYKPKHNKVRGIDPRNRNRQRYEDAGERVQGKY